MLNLIKGRVRWPTQTRDTLLVRLPKPEVGSAFIGLENTLESHGREERGMCVAHCEAGHDKGLCSTDAALDQALLVRRCSIGRRTRQSPCWLTSPRFSTPSRGRCCWCERLSRRICFLRWCGSANRAYDSLTKVVSEARLDVLGHDLLGQNASAFVMFHSSVLWRRLISWW